MNDTFPKQISFMVSTNLANLCLLSMTNNFSIRAAYLGIRLFVSLQ
jgi:hypothetical protein